MTPRRHLLLGLLFLAATGILSYYTLFKTDFSLLEERQSLTVYAEDARGLRKGAPVLYAGVRWGKIDSVAPDLDRPREERVKIELSLDRPIRLFEDHRVSIESASVLGGVQLGIDPGSRDAGEIDANGDLRARSAPDVLASLGEVVDENREPLRNAIAGIESAIASLNSGSGTFARLLNDEATANDLSNAIKNIDLTFENARALTAEIREGQGTMGKLLTESKIHDDIEQLIAGLDGFTAEARQLLTDAREGKGVLSAIVYDEEIAAGVKNTVASLESASAKIDQGDGTIAKLINDGALAESLQTAVDGFSNPNGTIGKLLNDPAVYDGIQTIVADVADATAALRTREGILGMLVYDTAARDNLLQAVNVLTGSLEEQREAAPIATFLSTVFLGF